MGVFLFFGGIGEEIGEESGDDGGDDAGPSVSGELGLSGARVDSIGTKLGTIEGTGAALRMLL